MKLKLYNIKIFLLGVCFLLPSLTFTQNSKQDSVWKPFESFIGNWTGKGGGAAGEGTYERSYNFIFNKKYIEVKNKSIYPPTKNKPSGEVHEDVGYISFDKIRKTFVLRQFHIEGFVNQYMLDSVSADGKRLVFVSESIENIKPGWRAKEVYEIGGDSEITETFLLSPPDKEFEVYSKAILKKKN